MGRLLGIAAADVTPFARWLISTPHSLGGLASATPEGWGAALYDRSTREWSVERRPFGTTPEETFAAMTPRLRGTVMVAHLRARSDAASASATTHPLRRGGWVFAHDGAIDDVDFLLRTVSAARLRERTDNSRSELLFSALLTRLDAAGSRDTGAVLADAVAELVENRVGATSFLLSDGERLYAHRHGPPLHLLEELAGARVVIVASEPLTDGAWRELADGSLVRCDAVLADLEPKSERELPFTD